MTKAQKKDGDQSRSVQSRRKENKDRTQSNQQQCKHVSTQIQQCKLLKESARLRGVLGQGSNLIIFCFGFVDCRNIKTLDKLTDQPGNLIPLDRAGVPDLSVSGDKFDLVEVDPHDPTTTSEPEAPMQSLNQLPVVTDLVDARSA